MVIYQRYYTVCCDLYRDKQILIGHFPEIANIIICFYKGLST